MNAESQSCISASLMYMTYDEHISYGKYVYSKSVILKHIGQGYYRKQVSSYTNTYDILEMLHSLNFLSCPCFLRQVHVYVVDSKRFPEFAGTIYRNFCRKEIPVKP